MRIIAGACRGRSLKTVTGPGYRPAMSKVRESLFSMLESRGVVWSGVRVLDLFAGSGSLGFEALSRGALESVFVEKDTRAAACLGVNVKNLGMDTRSRILADDVLKALARRPAHPFDIIFVDPPYGQSLLTPALRQILRLNWLAEEGFLVAEVENRLPLPSPPGLELDTERLYGQTRIAVWYRPTPEQDTTPGLDLASDHLPASMPAQSHEQPASFPLAKVGAKAGPETGSETGTESCAKRCSESCSGAGTKASKPLEGNAAHPAHAVNSDEAEPLA